MSTVNGFQVGSETLKYNYESLDNYNTPNFSTSSSKTYAVGDYVMYNGKLYKCTTATTGGTWVSGSWTLAVLSDDVNNLSRQLSDVQSELSDVDIRLTTIAGENYIDNVTIVQGAINGQGNVASTIAANRARFQKAIMIPYGTKVKSKNSNYVFNVFLFTHSTIASSNLIINTNNYTSEYIYDGADDVYIAITIKRSDDSDFDASTLVPGNIIDLSLDGAVDTLEKNVEDLDAALEEANDTLSLITVGIDYTEQYELTQGAISGNGNISSTIAQNRARSLTTVFVKKGTIISVISSEYQVSCFYYRNKTIAASNLLKTFSYSQRQTIGLDTWLAFNISRIDGGDFDASSIALSDVLEIKYEEPKKKTFYVGLSGSDDNDGLSAETPFKTFQKALYKGANVIYAQRGVYHGQSIRSLDQYDSLEILPYESNTFAGAIPDRPLIEINNGIILSELTETNGILSQEFSGTERFRKVFIDKTLSPIITILSYEGYNVGVWQTHSDESLDKELKPVLTLTELQNEAGTVYWDGTTVYINPYQTAYTSFVVCGDVEYGVDIQNKSNVVLQDVSVKYSLYTNIQLRNCINCVVQNCESLYTVLDDGYSFDNSNVNFYKCISKHAMSDGYNIHDYGESNLFDCESWYNLDDGISHHKGCRGSIFGGQYNYNGKGGNSPTTGAIVNSFNAIYKGNRWGFYSVKAEGLTARTHVVNGNLFIDNEFAIRCSGSGQKVISINNVYANNTYNNVTDTEGIIDNYSVNDNS